MKKTYEQELKKMSNVVIEPLTLGILTYEEKKKDLQYWWDEYRKASKWYIQSDNPMEDVDWPTLIDFYRWLADEFNGDTIITEWEEIYCDNISGEFCIGIQSSQVHSVIVHKLDTAQKVLDIIGEDLMKKIFQI